MFLVETNSGKKSLVSDTLYKALKKNNALKEAYNIGDNEAFHKELAQYIELMGIKPEEKKQFLDVTNKVRKEMNYTANSDEEFYNTLAKAWKDAKNNVSQPTEQPEQASDEEPQEDIQTNTQLTDSEKDFLNKINVYAHEYEVSNTNLKTITVDNNKIYAFTVKEGQEGRAKKVLRYAASTCGNDTKVDITRYTDDTLNAVGNRFNMEYDTSYGFNFGKGFDDIMVAIFTKKNGAVKNFKDAITDEIRKTSIKDITAGMERGYDKALANNGRIRSPL